MLCAKLFALSKPASTRTLPLRWRRLIFSSYLLLASTPALAISNITVMADENVSLGVTKLARAYARANGVAVVTSFVSKEQQAAQILEGSAADVLITSDSKWLTELQTQGLVDIYSKKEFARGHIALVGAKASTLSVNLTTNFSTAPIIVAMHSEPALYLGNPEDVPEGKYAKQSLRNLSVSDELEPYILYLKSTDEMIEQVTKHHAYCIMSYSRALLLNDAKVIDIFPDKSHAPIVYYAIAIASDNMDEARKFIKFLGSKAAESSLASSGLIANKH